MNQEGGNNSNRANADNKKLAGMMGLAIKAGAAVIGTDNIVRARGLKLIMIDGDLGKNSKKAIAAAAEKQGARLIESAAPLSVITNIDGCKAAAVTNKGFADELVKLIM